MTLAVIALLSFLGNCVVVAGFLYLGRVHAQERQFLINTALSNNTYEFAVRQSASEPRQQAPAEDDDFDEMPDGLFG